MKTKLKKVWFSYDPQDGFELHETEAEAKSQAERDLAAYRDDADADGWDEEVVNVCWGKVFQKVGSDKQVSYKLKP